MKKPHDVLSLLLTTILLTSCELSLPSLPIDSNSSTSTGSTSLMSSQEETSDISEVSHSSTEVSSMPSSMVSSLDNNTEATSQSTLSSSSPLSSSAESSIVSSLPTSTSSVTTSQTTSTPSSQSLITIASNAPTYYQNISPSATGQALKQALKTLISTSISVSYDWSRFESADESLTDSTKVLTIYPRKNYAKSAHVSGNSAATWNREHTYPDSKVSGNADSDNHHIYADDWKTNNERGNLRFGDVANTESNRVKDSSNLGTDNFKGSIGGETFFEPNDVAKGEVARATLYLNTLYGYALNGNFHTDELAVLWALQYPPTNRDMQRNNRVFTNQKNRNPYVDHTEWICEVYGQTSLATQSVCGA